MIAALMVEAVMVGIFLGLGGHANKCGEKCLMMGREVEALIWRRARGWNNLACCVANIGERDLQGEGLDGCGDGRDLRGGEIEGGRG